MRRTTTAEVRPDAGRATRFSASARSIGGFDRLPCTRHAIWCLLKTPEGAILASHRLRIRRMSGKSR